MNIGAAAKATNMPTKTVRYYADIGLVKPQTRALNGYRVYTETEIRKLVFVRRAREFGFSIKDCRELLGLYEDRQRSSRDVKIVAERRLEEIEAKLLELNTLRNELSRLVAACKGDNRPDCPILDAL